VIRGNYISNVVKLDEIPVPDYSDFDLTNYLNKNGVNVFASRGCPNKCVFCSERNYFSNFKFRKADVIFNDIKELMRRHANVFEFNFADSISNASIVELEKLCDLIIEADLDIHLIFQNAVIRKEMRSPLYKKLKAAGCILIGYGMESPNPILLEGIGKTLSKNVDIGAVIKEGTDAGINISINVMFGLPGETENDFDILMNFLKEHKNDIGQINPAINFCALYPGSFGNMEPEKWGIELNDSSDYWEIKDDDNTYLTRLDRFEKFTTLAREMGLDNLFGIEEITNKNEMIGLYYFHKNDYESACKYLESIPKQDVSMSVDNALSIINNIGTTKSSIIPDFLIPAHEITSLSVVTLMLSSDFTVYINHLKDVVKYPSFPVPTWKRNIRKLSHIIFNKKKYDEKILEVLSLYSVFQIVHIAQSDQIYYLLEDFGVIGKKPDEQYVQHNENIDLIGIYSEFKKKVSNANSLINSSSVFNKLYQIAGYNKFIRGLIEIINQVDIIIKDIQSIDEQTSNLKKQSRYIMSSKSFDISAAFKNNEESNFDLVIRKNIVNIFSKQKSIGSYDELVNVSEQMLGFDRIQTDLAVAYRFLQILNHQNKIKLKILQLLSELSS